MTPLISDKAIRRGFGLSLTETGLCWPLPNTSVVLCCVVLCSGYRIPKVDVPQLG